MKSRFLLLLACVLLSVVIVAPVQAASLSPRVVGGTPAAIAEMPWIVSLNRGSCGGTLIAPHYVLTAASCVTTSKGVAVRPSALTVIAGSVDASYLGTGGVESSVTKIAVNPKYSSNGWAGEGGPYDAAILELASDLPYQPLTLATTANAAAYAAGATARIAGWGATNAAGTNTDGVLLQARLPIVSNADCAASNDISLVDASKMICAGLRRGGVDICNGDGGGPLTVVAGAHTPGLGDDRTLLAGIASTGYDPCGSPDRPSMYTRVAMLTGWIAPLLAGNVEAWHRAADQQAPKVQTKAASAERGGTAKLWYRIRGETGPTTESITIRRTRSSTILRRVGIAAAVNDPLYFYNYRWAVPRTFATGAYVWCMTAKDAVGNTSAVSCSNLTIR